MPFDQLWRAARGRHQPCGELGFTRFVRTLSPERALEEQRTAAGNFKDVSQVLGTLREVLIILFQQEGGSMDQAQRNLSDVMMEIYRNYDFQFLIQMSPYWFRGKSLDDGETGDKRSMPRLVWDRSCR